MKIVEYSKGSITEVENVFKVVESGAQGPQGPAGTIGTLDLLDPKVTPVDADLMLVGDSAASFANKAMTWANVKATLKAVFDAIYQPLSTALSKITEAGGLPLWDGGAWPGGGGGGLWEIVESRAMTGNSLEVFDVQSNNDLFIFDSVTLGSASTMSLGVSYDGGATYKAKNLATGISQVFGTADAAFSNTNTSTAKMSNLTFLSKYSGEVEFRDLTGASTLPEYISTAAFIDASSLPNRADMAGYCNFAGVVDKIRFNSAAMDSGTIHHFKRTF